MQSKEIIEAAIRNDPEASPEQKQAILKVLNNRSSLRPKLITRKQAGEILDVCPETVKRYQKRGLLKAIKFTSRRLRYDEEAVIELARTGVTESMGAA